MDYSDLHLVEDKLSSIAFYAQEKSKTISEIQYSASKIREAVDKIDISPHERILRDLLSEIQETNHHLKRIEGNQFSPFSFALAFVSMITQPDGFGRQFDHVVRWTAG